MTMVLQDQPRFFLYRFCLELDAQVRDIALSTSLRYCTIRVPSYTQISLLKRTTFLSGAYIHDEAGTNVSSLFGKHVSAAWASFLEREAVAFDAETRAPAFLTQAEWDFVWKHTQGLTSILPCPLLHVFNSQFSRAYGTFQLLAATINTLVLPQYIDINGSVQDAFRKAWNHSSLIQDVLGLPPLCFPRDTLPGPVRASDCRDAFLRMLLVDLDREIELLEVEGNCQSLEAKADVNETRK